MTRWTITSRAGRTLSAALLLFFVATITTAQDITGYGPATATTQRAAETAAIARPDTVRAGALARALADRPHIAGTPEQARTRDLVLAALRDAGITTEVREYQVWLPHTIE